MEIQHAGSTLSKSNQLRTVNTTQPREIVDRKSEVIAFVVNVGMNVTANYFYILTEKETLGWNEVDKSNNIQRIYMKLKTHSVSYPHISSSKFYAMTCVSCVFAILFMKTAFDLSAAELQHATHELP